MASETSQGPDLALKSLQSLPGVGPSIAGDLLRLGFREPQDLRGQNAEAMFERLKALSGVRQDPMVLDAFRCAVHSANAAENHPELIKPWVWGRLRTDPVSGR